MITYLVKERFVEATYARAGRQQAFARYLSRLPGAVTHYADAGRGPRTLRGTAEALLRLFEGVAVAWSSRNRWVVVDYPNHPASVPRRLSVFLVACAYLGCLRLACAARGMSLIVQSDDDPALQDEWLSGAALTPMQLFWERGYERLLFRCADRLWFSGESAAEAICDRFSVPLPKAYHVPNGAPAAEEDIRLGGPPGTFRFAYAGALYAETHAVRGLIDAFRDVEDRRARLLLFGPNGSWIPGYLSRHGDGRVQYLGCLTAERAQAVLAGCDAGLLTGDPEGYGSTGFPGKLGAYLGAGLPVVTTCGGEVARLIASRDVGVVCGRDGLARAMNGLLADRAAHLAMRRRAQESSDEYRWDSIFARAVDTLRSERAGRQWGRLRFRGLRRDGAIVGGESDAD